MEEIILDNATKARNKRQALKRHHNRALDKIHRQQTARKNYLARCARRRSHKKN
jgi:hypothetical protein